MKVEFYRHDLGEAELASLKKTLETPFLTVGPRVAEFEGRIAREVGVAHAVGVTSCTMGLHVTMHALGVGPGDEVVTTPMTYISTPNAALYVGATPVFADVERDTGLIDPEAVRRAITPKTKAILAVHLYGQMADVRALRAIADEHGIALVEDAAHGFEAERDGARPGQVGDAAVLSFYPTKTITAGDGGMVLTNRADLDARLRRLRNHGVTKDAIGRYGSTYKHWDMVELGFKAALTDVQASLLLPQLDRAHARRDRRQAVDERYRRELAGAPNVELLRVKYGRSTHHVFPALVPRERRDAILEGLGHAGVGAAINYRAVHTLQFYREKFGFAPDAFPIAEDIGAREISLPIWPDLPLDAVSHVARVLRDLAA